MRSPITRDYTVVSLRTDRFRPDSNKTCKQLELYLNIGTSLTITEAEDLIP